MNQKQKLGYMALGAGILAIGIIIGQFVTPDIEAQSNGVFDNITCRSLKVVDENGKTAIQLDTSRFNNTVTVFDKVGNESILLTHTLIGTTVTVLDKVGNKAIALGSGVADGNGVAIFDKAGKTAIRLQADEEGNDLQVLNKEEVLGIGLGTHAKGNGVTVFDKAGNRAIVLDGAEEFNTVMVYDKAGETGDWFLRFYYRSNANKAETINPALRKVLRMVVLAIISSRELGVKPNY